MNEWINESSIIQWINDECPRYNWYGMNEWMYKLMNEHYNEWMNECMN